MSIGGYFMYKLQSKALCLALFVWLLQAPLLAQNLVPDPDFSQMNVVYTQNNPITYNDFIDIAPSFTHWFRANHVFGVMFTHLPTSIDLYTIKPNSHSFYYPNPTSGHTYFAINTFNFTAIGNPNRRLYLSTKLTAPVQQGKWYRFQADFFMGGHKGDLNPHNQYTNNLGFVISDSLYQDDDQVIKRTPFYHVDTVVPLQRHWYSIDTCMMMPVSGQFLTIGSFFTQEQTIFDPTNPLACSFGVDNIRLSALQLSVAGGDTVYGCTFAPLTLTASNDCHYLWAKKSHPSQILHQGPTYTFIPDKEEYFLVYGLSDTVEVYIKLDESIGLNLGKDTLLCPNEMLELQVGHLQAERVLWSNGSTESNMVVDSPGLYWVQVERGHCVEVDSIRVSYEIFAEAAITPNKEETCLGDVIQLSTTQHPSYSYQWSTGAQTPTIEIDKNDRYWVEVSNYCGVAYDTLEVAMEPCTCTVYLPNAFKPESTVATNRGFAPVSDCVYIDYDFHVFNRWGNRVFQTHDPQATWDGTQNGNPCPAGVYIYQVYYKGFNEKGYRTIETKRGQVTLIR